MTKNNNVTSNTEKTKENDKTQNTVKKNSGVTTGTTQGKPAEATEKTSMAARVFAIFGLVIIVGLYILSLVASLSDWENSFGIFTGALAATIFVPIVIHLIRTFSGRNSDK